MTTFEQTLNQISIKLNNNLNSSYKKVTVQGCNKPNNVTLLLTIFDIKHNYTMEFFTLKNFRLFKVDNDYTEEMVFIDKYINFIKPNVSKYFNF